MSSIDDLAAQLTAIAEELDDVIFEQLRSAAADGSMTRAAAADKQLVQARRAVEKAANLLQRATAAGDEPAG